MKSVAESVQTDNRVGGFRQHQYVRIYTDSEGRIRMDTTQKTPVELAKNTEKQVSNTNLSKPSIVANPSKLEANKPKEIYKDGFRQHSYIKIYKDKDGKMRVDTTSFERPK
jgi:ribosome maturation factor RimP